MNIDKSNFNNRVKLLSKEIKNIQNFFGEKSKKTPLCLRKEIIKFYYDNRDIRIGTVLDNFNLVSDLLHTIGMGDEEVINYLSRHYSLCFYENKELFLNFSIIYDIGLIREVVLGYTDTFSSSFSITTERLYALILDYENRRIVPTFENLFRFRDISGSWDDLTNKYILTEEIKDELIERFNEYLNGYKKTKSLI